MDDKTDPTMTLPPDAVPVKIVCTANGPNLVHGAQLLVKADGTEVVCEPGKVTALCACGKSETKPYCNGAHAR